MPIMLIELQTGAKKIDKKIRKIKREREGGRENKKKAKE